MATRYKTKRIPSPTLGMVLNLRPWEVPPRSLVVDPLTGLGPRNVRTLNGALTSIGGGSTIATNPNPFPIIAKPGLPIGFIGTAQFVGTQQSAAQAAIIATNQFIYRLVGGVLNQLNMNAYNAPPGTLWEMATILNQVIFAQPADPLQVLTPQITLGLMVAGSSNPAGDNPPPPATNTGIVGDPGTVPSGLTITEFYNHLIVGNVAVGAIVAPTSFVGSDAGDASYWNTGNVNRESRSFPVPFNNDPILAVRKIGAYMVIFKTFSIFLVTYFGGTLFIYQVQNTNAATGTPSGKSCVLVASQEGNNDRIYFVGQDNIYYFDGNANPIGIRIWTDFISRVNPSFFSSIVGWYHYTAKEIYWGFVSAGQAGPYPDTALVYDILNDCFYYRDWPFTCGGYMTGGSNAPLWNQASGTWQGAQGPWVTGQIPAMGLPFVGDKNGNVFGYESVAAADYPAVATTSLDDYGDSERYKTVNGMRLDIQVTGTVANGVLQQPFQVWGRGLNELSEYNTAPWVFLGSTDGSSYVTFFLTGRWIQYQFRQAAGGSFVLGSYEPSYRIRGES